MSLFDYTHDNHDEMVSLFQELLSEKKVDPNETNEHGMTPLHHVVTELFDSDFTVHKDDMYIIKVLLEHGANPDIQDKWGRTPIMCFEPKKVRYCNKYMIFDALRDCTNLTLKDKKGKTFHDNYWKITVEE